jgi:hypothetical protein
MVQEKQIAVVHTSRRPDVSISSAIVERFGHEGAGRPNGSSFTSDGLLRWSGPQATGSVAPYASCTAPASPFRRPLGPFYHGLDAFDPTFSIR